MVEKKNEKAKDKEQELLESRSQHMRKYLMDKVIPPLAEGILKLCKDQPEDPISFLVIYLAIEFLIVRMASEEIGREGY